MMKDSTEVHESFFVSVNFIIAESNGKRQRKNFCKDLTLKKRFPIMIKQFAGLAHLVERHLAKVEVASSSLVTRSKDV